MIDIMITTVRSIRKDIVGTDGLGASLCREAERVPSGSDIHADLVRLSKGLPGLA